MSATKTCEKCDAPFDLSLPGYLCPKCRKSDREDIQSEGSHGMPEGVVKEKKCIGCGKPYTPTGNCQKYCPDCKSEKAPKSNKRESAPLILPKSASEDTMILRRLVAIGIITEEKIEQARKIVLNLKA